MRQRRVWTVPGTTLASSVLRCCGVSSCSSGTGGSSGSPAGIGTRVSCSASGTIRFTCGREEEKKVYFLNLLKNKITFNFVIFVATKKRKDNKFFFTLAIFWGPGSEIRDGQKSGSGLNIPDQQQ
jgi:hypothetical protein